MLSIARRPRMFIIERRRLLSPTICKFFVMPLALVLLNKILSAASEV